MGNGKRKDARRADYHTHLVSGTPSLTLLLSSLVVISCVSKAVVGHQQVGLGAGRATVYRMHPAGRKYCQSPRRA